MGVFLFSKTVPMSENKFKSIGLMEFLFSGLLKSNLATIKFFPPIYEVLDFLGPTPKASKPLNHLPPKENLSSVAISEFCNE